MKSRLGCWCVLKSSHGPLPWTFVLVLCLLLAVGCASKQPGAVDKQVEATRELGVVLMQEGRPRAALREFLRAQDLNPKNPKVQDHLGIVLLTLQRPDEAVVHLERAVKLDPKFSNAKNNLGSAYLALENWDSAIKVFEDLLSDLTYPTPWMPASGLGWAYFSKEDYDQAEEYYLMAVDQSPSYALGWRGLGRLYMVTGHLGKAMNALEKAVDLAPNFVEAQYDLGVAYLRANQTSQALETLGKVCALAPGTEICTQAHSKIQTIGTIR